MTDNRGQLYAERLGSWEAGMPNKLQKGSFEHRMRRLLLETMRYEIFYLMLAASGSAYMERQKDKGMWNGFDFYFYLDRINRMIRNFCACGEGPFGRRPPYPDDPVNPVQ